MEETTRIAISKMVSRRAGLNFPASHWGDLDRGIRNACDELKITDPLQFIQDLLGKESDPHQLETLICHLTIGETYFFREKPILDAFTGKILPELVKQQEQKDRSLNIWCAGCCTGEEPYTLAILLKEQIPDISSWNIKIKATDINKKFLGKATRGKYSAWSFRETPADLRKKYFTPDGNGFVIDAGIRKMVTFSQLNLVDSQLSLHGIYPEDIHVIFCRNVLMYFTPDNIRKSYESFCEVLVPGGWMVTSSVEVPGEPPAHFRFKRIGQVTVMQKTDKSHDDEKRFNLPHLKVYPKPIIMRTVKPVTQTTAKQSPPPPVKSAEPKPRQSDIVSVARRAFQKQAYGEVIRLLGNLKSAADSPDAMLLLIRSHANLGQLGEAKSLADKLLEQNKPESSFFYLQATILLELGEDKQAEEALRKALYLDPGLILAHFLMGNLFRRRGEGTLAHKHYRNVLKLIKELPDDSDLPDSEGMTVGYLRETIHSMLQ